MKYSESEIRQYVAEEDVKFLRMTFFDLTGNQKNMSILPDALDRAFSTGIAFDASAIPGFGDELRSDLFLQPDTSTLCLLPWRPDHGRVARLFCRILRSDGTPFEGDSRALLQKAVDDAAAMGVSFAFGSEMEFYLFRRDENGEPTTIPYDRAGYMDIAPEDKGENVRREICLTLEQMGIRPECSHHEQGPGQNEIDFRYAEPVKAADDAVTFRTVVNTVALRNGLAADFSPKPLRSEPGNGMHINLSARSSTGEDIMPQVIAGILSHIAASAATRRRAIFPGQAKTARSSSAFPPPRASTAARSFDPRTRSATRILPIPSSSTPVSTVYAAAQSCPQARTSTFTPRRRRSVRSIRRCPQRSRTQKPRQERANLSPPPCRRPLWSIIRSKRR